jgi:hypothetical protein
MKSEPEWDFLSIFGHGHGHLGTKAIGFSMRLKQWVNMRSGNENKPKQGLLTLCVLEGLLALKYPRRAYEFRVSRADSTLSIIYELHNKGRYSPSFHSCGFLNRRSARSNRTRWNSSSNPGTFTKTYLYLSKAQEQEHTH